MSKIEELKAKLQQNLAHTTQQTQCSYLGNELGYTVQCKSCTGRVELKVFQCKLYGRCTLVNRPNSQGINGCDKCPSNTRTLQLSAQRVLTQPKPEPTVTQAVIPVAGRTMPIVWAYGITTVKSRRDNLFPRTLDSLKKAGFDRPHIFVDGGDAAGWDRFGLDFTLRGGQPVRTFGNWCLSLAELYLRNPQATHYAVFQDDFVTYQNLRNYLEFCHYNGRLPPQGYYNLYTFPSNKPDRLKLANMPSPPMTHQGWYRSNQNGRGAVALIFPRAGVQTLLCHKHMVERPTDAHRHGGHKAVDGGIVTAMNKAGWTEYVHLPTLVQHTGMKSSMDNKTHPLGVGFLGEGYNADNLIPMTHETYTGG